ncbi:EamA family transporter [Desulfocurvibacter africanus]|uniref:DMT family transporter n=1 Tax=Desulfocurvibacter africanus TaxID=873 RepID=UPI002FD87C73
MAHIDSESHASPLRPILALALTAAMWSSGGVLIKLVDLPPLAVAGLRSTVCALLLIALRGLPARPRDAAQIGAALAYAATVILFVSATKLTTAANAILLQFTAPIYVALLAPRILGERTTALDWLATAMVMAGMGLFFMDKLDFSGFWGNMAGLASGVSFGFMVLFLRKQKDGSPYGSLVWGNILAAAVCLPFCFEKTPDLSDVAGLLLLGVFQLGLPYLLYAWAVRQVSAMVAVLVPVVEPLLNPVWVYLILGERPGPWAMIGGAVVLIAVTGRSLLPMLLRPRSQMAHDSLG